MGHILMVESAESGYLSRISFAMYVAVDPQPRVWPCLRRIMSSLATSWTRATLGRLPLTSRWPSGNLQSPADFLVTWWWIKSTTPDVAWVEGNRSVGWGRCGLLIRPRTRPDFLPLPQTALCLRPRRGALLRLPGGRPRHPPHGLPPPRHVQTLRGIPRPVSHMSPFARPTHSGLSSVTPVILRHLTLSTMVNSHLNKYHY